MQIYTKFLNYTLTKKNFSFWGFASLICIPNFPVAFFAIQRNILSVKGLDFRIKRLICYSSILHSFS